METKSFQEWINLEGVEDQRTYLYAHPHINEIVEITIPRPSRLYVKASGSHKIVDMEGVLHYMPKGWLSIRIIGEFKFNVE